MCLSGAWRANREMRKSGAAPDPLWQGEHHASHHRLSISQRTDRQLLLSAYEQGKQIAQVRMSLFGVLPEPQPAVIPRDSEILAKALDFLQPLMEAYACGDAVDIPALKKLKDKSIATLGLVASSRMG
jgi:hypothetical protein